MDDAVLLKRYVDGKDQEAFADLVGRHGGWLNSAARRQLGDGHLAEDVTQAVFLLLSERAKGITHGRLSGWLFLALGYCVRETKRRRMQQSIGEKEAASMRKENVEEARWEEIAPELEEAVGKLGKADREVVLLRFYEQRPLAEVGRALGISEEAAKKRVQRAVEKLRQTLGGEGITGTTAGLSAVLVGNVVGQMPEGLIDKIVSAVASGGGSGVAAGVAKGAMKMMVMAKVKVAAVVFALAMATMVAAAAGVATLGEKKQVAASSGAAGIASTAGPAQQDVPATGPSGPKAAFMEIAASARRLDAKGVADGFDAQTADEREFVAAYAEGLVSMERFRQAMENRFGADDRYSLMGAGNSMAMLPLEQATERITGETASLEVANRTGGSIAVPMQLIGGRWRLPVNQMWEVIQKAAAANGGEVPPMKTVSEASRKTAPAYQHVAELIKSGTYASKDEALKALETEMTKARKD